ncbi:flagellar motor switch phosphatase FliY [Jeotgalibacillus haloalkalitolerans]|uniref:Flagellar motor switch phosphatase FliY n=1 Tax=Jeotgalibacillus haloalkalitolerans TaxID=3104292 RepID=A0ABU5KKN4_9BACL|nr:flagellar motor switch phosphatase FliY [Jeotgalibacillus sp. HH7-29]MDZ5711730.1 flagellar motor switch phosphatase FliY [Jeotgalibacillus sp. HH7-29]
MMSDDMLSQDEIDALLKGTADEEPQETIPEPSGKLDEVAIDALGEIGNISFGSSATALSTLLNQKVDITTPSVNVVKTKEISNSFPHPSVAINVHYTEGLKGNNLLVIKQSDAAVIADLMLGGDGTDPSGDLGEIQLSAVQEAMNQMMGSASTSMSTIFGVKVDISPPSIDLMDLEHEEGMGNLPEDDEVIQISFNLKIGSLIDSNIMQLIPLQFGQALVDQLMGAGQAEAVSEAAAAAPVAERPVQNEETEAVQPAESRHAEEVHTDGVQLNRERALSKAVDVQPAQFSQFESPGLSAGESRNLNLLLDIPLQVTVELGRTKRSVQEILELTSGSIIELDKLAGEPVDILVNNRLIAKGEVVVIEENFGVRLTDIISKSDRLNKLR